MAVPRATVRQAHGSGQTAHMSRGSAQGTVQLVWEYAMTGEVVDSERFVRVVQAIDPRNKLLRAWGLKGGVSAQVTALEIAESDGRQRTVVVRRHGEVDLRQNPTIAADEFKLLEIAHARGLAVPAPYYLDQTGTIFSTPYLIVEYSDGETEFNPSNVSDFMLQAATHLLIIHTVDGLSLELSFLPNKTDVYTENLAKRPDRMDESIGEGGIRERLESVWPIPQRNKSVLLHGDFWPGNLLWKDGQLVAVIDWEDAGLGDPLTDLANTRLEMLWAFGTEAMRQFTDHYTARASIDCGNLPYWDLYAALRPAFKIAEWAGSESAEKTMRERHTRFVTQAFDAIADL